MASLGYDTGPFEASDEELKDKSIDGDEKLLCGYGSCTPAWLQRFHNAKCLLLMLGICAFIQSFVVNAIFPVGLSTLERRFKMTSTHTGIISSWYDFAVLLVVFPVCHWGNSGHKGRWIGWGGIVMALGSLVCVFPHWIIDPYKPEHTDLNSTDFGQCTLRDLEKETCEKQPISSYLNPYFLLFVLGQTLHGVGSTPLFSIGTTFIDENVSQKASPVYLAIHAVLTSFGPVIGVFVGGFLLNIYDDFDRVDHPPIARNDPRWIGAWWVGFLVSAISALIIAFPILAFARELPEAKRHRAKDVNQCHAANADLNEKAPKDAKQLPVVIMKICKNPTFIVCIVIGIFESIIINGFAAFMPKILETLLSTTPILASYLSSVVIFAAAAGVMIGGMIIRKLRLQARITFHVGGMLKMIVCCHLVALIFTTGLLVHCPQRSFVGINTDYNDLTIHPNIEYNVVSECNADCSCKDEFNPICERDTGRMYYSPCYAGCTHKHDEHGKNVWSDCSCLQENFTGHPEVQHSDVLHQGYCNIDCGYNVYILMVTLFITVVASFASGIPTQQIMLRVVPFDQRTLALGINWTFLRLLGFIPGGILFGMMIDIACLDWEETCGRQQSCRVYDPTKLSWTITAVAIVCKLLSILTTIVGYMTYRPSDLDNGMSIQSQDSHGALHLVVNDDRPPEEFGPKNKAVEN
ncbi:sodium-independent organic anion transporter [Oesophagostomum dentatum]|uniref:Solute carrier organic anion transporter family member n=1 Tax=Oesophagostomum dentatum TaxID=61180 RepID=A0A0B1TCF5_OESDE|nr:sodium-independent organic anion transporter [Oesophagostomum dentatum]